MENPEHTVLCVDDEKNILNSLKRLLRKEDYRFLTANSCGEGLALLQENDIHLVITDQRMPEMSGTEFLARVKKNFPDIIRIVLTGYTEVDAITDAINKGSVYKFFLKPWNDQNLVLEIRQALDHYDLVKANQKLHAQVLAQIEELKQTNENLENLVQQRTRTLEMQNQALELSQEILNDMPVPVIGVSSEGAIVFINEYGQALTPDGNRLQLGRTVAECFSLQHADYIMTALSVQQTAGTVPETLDLNDSYRMHVRPLSGRFNGQGAVVTFFPLGL